MSAARALALAAALTVPGAARGETCSVPRANEPVLLLVVAADAELAERAALVDRAIRRAARGRLELAPSDATRRALEVEGGAEDRERALIDARVVITRAEEKFRELDDEEALSLLAKATARLSSVHQEPGAIALLAHAHFLAGAIYLARGRTDAARQRLFRALDLQPQLAPARDRFAPEVLAELAAVRAQSALRPAGRVVIRATEVQATVFIDGRRAGVTPLELDNVPAGNHLLRVAAPGRLSHVETFQLEPREDFVLDARLVPDPELAAITAIGRRAALGEDLRETMALAARRGGATRTLLASMRLGAALTRSGTATIGVELSLSGANAAYTPDLDAPNLAAAIARVSSCDTPAERSTAVLAPSIFGLEGAFTSDPAPVPEPVPPWREPWFWAVAAVAAIGVSGALVVGRTSGGPPEEVEIRLIPRP